MKECGAALLVLANNETLPLLVKMLPITSVAFAEEPVDIPMLISWLQTFYGLLSENYSLADACRKTYAQHQIPVRLYPKLYAEAVPYKGRLGPKSRVARLVPSPGCLYSGVICEAYGRFLEHF